MGKVIIVLSLLMMAVTTIKAIMYFARKRGDKNAKG